MALFRCAVIVTLVAGVVAACAAPGSSSSPTPASQPTAAPTATSGPAATDAPSTILVELNDEMRIEPASMTVPAGVPVTFVVTNVGQIEHELYLGDESAQAEHEEEMMSGEMGHGHSNAVTVAPGATEELTFTFTPGEWLAGCHVPGHYPAGMKATIAVEE